MRQILIGSVVLVVLLCAGPLWAATVTMAWDYGSLGQTGFTLRRCAGVSCAPSASLGLTLGPTVRQATDPNAAQGTSYCWDVIALADGVTATDSAPSAPLCLTVPVAAVATSTRWVTQPTNALTNLPLTAVQVEIVDQFGSRVTTATAPITIYITPGEPLAIPNSQVTFISVDSQETAGEQDDGPRAVDGLTTTFWHTQWQAASPGYPHTLIVDLRTPFNLTGFRYLPRQDANVNGTILTYQFFVSTDGSTWGTAVSSGSFTPPDQTEKTKRFMGRNARYIKFEGDSEINGNPWASVAELTALYSVSGSGNVVGTSTVNAVNGLATFSSVAVNAPGSYTMDSDCPGLVQATSTTFAISDPPILAGPQVRRVVQ